MIEITGAIEDRFDEILTPEAIEFLRLARDTVGPGGALLIEGNVGAMVKLKSETDFVAGSDLFKNEADEIRTLGRILEKGYLYRGLKPVNWCFDCQSALAEAEVEYEDRVDIAIDVGMLLDPADQAKLAKAFGLAQLPAGPVRAVIWTTTPWTLPANQCRRANC